MPSRSQALRRSRPHLPPPDPFPRVSKRERLLQIQKKPRFLRAPKNLGIGDGAYWIVICKSLLEANDLSAVDLPGPAVSLWADLERFAGSAWREHLFRISQRHGNPALLEITTTALVILFARFGGINDNLADILFGP